jgi:hypothetical protein
MALVVGELKAMLKPTSHSYLKERFDFERRESEETTIAL